MIVDPGFTTESMSACWSAAARIRAMLDVERAVARAAGDDPAIASEIAAACALPVVDAEAVLRTGWEVGTPVAVLRDQLAATLSPSAAAALRSGHGTTTQDIVDTAMQLQIRDGLHLLTAEVALITGRLRQLAHAHRSTPMIGRTFLQHARPTTFGLRAALWLDAVGALAAELRVAGSSCCVQLGGPVGVFGDTGERGISTSIAAALDLRVPVAPWHGDRSRIASTCELVGRVARCMAKVATDVALLASTEIAEVSVRAGGSSSMADKRNPFDSVRAIAAADACAGAVATVAGARPIELERGLGGWHVEWFAVPLVFATAAGAVEAMRRCLDSLVVDADAMRRHLGDVAVDDLATAVRIAAATADRILLADGR